MENTVLMIDGAQGVYVPKLFAEYFSDAWGVDEYDKALLLEGPDHDLYWETWDEVLNKAQFTDKSGEVWHLWQDGDLFMYSGDGEQWV